VFQDPDLTLTIYRLLSLYGRIIIVVVRISLKVSSKWDVSGIGPAKQASARRLMNRPSAERISRAALALPL